MIKVDQNTCIGCGLCAGMCPDVFALNLDGKSEVIAQTNETCAKQAAEACPVGAISVE
jgi:ferredoxin